MCGLCVCVWVHWVGEGGMAQRGGVMVQWGECTDAHMNAAGLLAIYFSQKAGYRDHEQVWESLKLNISSENNPGIFSFDCPPAGGPEPVATVRSCVILHWIQPQPSSYCSIRTRSGNFGWIL